MSKSIILVKMVKIEAAIQLLPVFDRYNSKTQSMEAKLLRLGILFKEVRYCKRPATEQCINKSQVYHGVNIKGGENEK
jgi:hypothetical protein